MEAFKIEQINPELASTLLQGNVDNRNVAKRHVEFLSEQMKSGKWMFCADPIRISSEGRVLDGQHRLMAVIKAGVTLDFLVIRGLSSDIFPFLDTGKSRSASDVLSSNHIENANRKAALARRIMLYDSGFLNLKGGVGTKKISNSDVLNYVRKNELNEVVLAGSRHYEKFRGFSITDYGLFKLLFDRISEDDCSVFLEKLSSGNNLSDGDPILLLRNRIIDDMSNIAKLSATIKLALTIRAWNHFRDGKTLKILQHSTQGDFPIPK
jgi:hypothetical protein